MSTHNLCFEQKYEKYQSFLSENFQFLEVKFSIYLYRHVFVMIISIQKIIFVVSVQYISFGFSLESLGNMLMNSQNISFFVKK